MWSAVILRRRVKGMTWSPSLGRYGGTLNDPYPTPGMGGTKPPPWLMALARATAPEDAGRGGDGAAGSTGRRDGGRGGAARSLARRTSSLVMRPRSPEP